MEAEVGRLLATSENFYARDEEPFHEIGFFYAATLPPEARPNGLTPWLVREDEGHILHNIWVPLKGSALDEVNLMPGWLPDFIRNLPASTAHILHDTREITS